MSKYRNIKTAVDGIKFDSQHEAKRYCELKLLVRIGEMKLEAMSISFASMDDIKFEKVYSAVADVILQKVLLNYKDRDELDEIIDRVMRFL